MEAKYQYKYVVEHLKLAAASYDQQVAWFSRLVRDLGVDIVDEIVSSFHNAFVVSPNLIEKGVSFKQGDSVFDSVQY